MYKSNHSKSKSEFRSQRQQNEPVDTYSSEIVETLRICAQELEQKQDRSERIVKIGRDITIDSKRLIFYLHTFQSGSPDAEKVLTEAKLKLIKIVKSNFFNIAKEVENLDAHQFSRAYTWGVQEFMEAFSFYHYLVNNTILTFKDVEEFLEPILNEEFEKSNQNDAVISKKDGNEPSNRIRFADQCYFVSMLDYVLGLSDLTGELMRYCINQVAAGKIDTAFDTCRFLTNLYTGMMSVGSHSREFNRKMSTSLQNVRKVEMACYTVRVRGSEMPKHMIFDVLNDENQPEEVHF